MELTNSKYELTHLVHCDRGTWYSCCPHSASPNTALFTILHSFGHHRVGSLSKSQISAYVILLAACTVGTKVNFFLMNENWQGTHHDLFIYVQFTQCMLQKNSQVYLANNWFMVAFSGKWPDLVSSPCNEICLLHDHQGWRLPILQQKTTMWQ